MSDVNGIHHITAIAGDPQENLDFYAGVLGMRLVKKSVNQDDPGTYHLFYADAVGQPGSDLTFFPWPNLPRGRPGAGMATEVALAVPPGSLGFWAERLERYGTTPAPLETRFGERSLPLADPHGLPLVLVESADRREFTPWEGSPIDMERQVMRLHGVRLVEGDFARSVAFLTRVFGYEPVGEEGGWHRFAAPGAGSGRTVELRAPSDAQPGRLGVGTVHHVAWRVADDTAQAEVRRRVAEAGRSPTPVIDRFWFRSVYFHEPGGVLFELATDGPGFAVDEDPSRLGEQLILPPWLESRRKDIEAVLPPLEPVSPGLARLETPEGP